MIYLLVFQLCLGYTIDKTIYLQENEYYQQGLYDLFSDTIDHQYSFIDSSKGFYIIDSNLKQEQAGRYATNPTNIITQKQFKNLEDYQGNQQYGVLFKDQDNGYQLCYNSNLQNLDIDFCIQLDDNYYGYDFTFLDYNTVAISSIQNNLFQVLVYQGDTIIGQLSFYQNIYYSSLKSTKIDIMVYNNQKYLLVAGSYQIYQKNIPIDVLMIQSDYTIIQSSFSFNFMDNVFDMKGTINGTIFVQGLFYGEKYIFQIQFQNEDWIILNQYQQQNNICFDLGYSTTDGASFRSFILVSDTNYQLQSQDNKTQIQSQFQKVIKQDSIFKFTKNYLIFLQDNQLIISNFKNNIQRINQFTSQILSIDVDFQNDKLIVFTISEIIKFQLQDIYLAYQGLKKTNNLDIVTISNGLRQVNIYFRVLETSDNNLYSLTNEVDNIYYNSIYSPGPFKLPVFVSGFNPKLQVFTDKQLKIEAYDYQNLEAKLDNEIPLFQQILVTDGLTSILKQYENFSYLINQCYQNNQKLDCKNTIQASTFTYEQIKLYTQQGVNQGFLILVNNSLDIYTSDKLYFQIKDIENITDVVVTDKIFVVYQTFIKVYTYPNAIEIYKLDIQQLNIDNPIKIWANNLYNNYLFILTQTGQLVIGQFTNRFYLTQIIQFDNTNIDISIVTNDKIILSQQNNDGLIDVSVYNLDNGQIVKQYPLDLHNYTTKNYILYKDYLNGLIGIQAQLDQQNVLLLYGFAQQQRDQLQKIIYLDEDYDTISICSNKDQTQILQTQKQKPNLKVFYVHHGYQYVYVQQSEYIPNKFSQALPITYLYSSDYDSQNFTIQSQIFYEKDYTTVECHQKLIEVVYQSDQSQLEYELPKNIFSGQVSYVRTTNKDDIELETRVKNYQAIENFGYLSKCQQVTKYERILCLNGMQLTYHKYNGDLIQQVEFYFTQSANLIVNIDNSNAIVFQDTGLSLISISQNSISLYQNSVPVFLNTSIITCYKNWIINYENNQMNFYQITYDEYWNFYQQYQLYIPDIGKYDYHPQSESIYYTQNNSILTILKCSLEGDTLNISSIKTYDIQDNLFKQQIYTIDLKLNYLKIFDNNIVISSNYGHIYTFNIDNLQLINIYLITGPSAYVRDIYIIEGYLILKGEYQLFLYENKNDWNINKPYLSLETIYNRYDLQFVALYKDDQNKINILFLHGYWGYLANSIIDDRYILKFSNLQQNPAPFYIVVGNPYNYNYTLIQSIKQHKSQSFWFLIALGVILIIGIVWYIWKKKKQPQQDILILN